MSIARTTLAALAAIAMPASAGATVDSVSTSPDRGIKLGAVEIRHEDIAVDNTLGIALKESLGALPETAGIDGYHRISASEHWFSLDSGATLPPGIFVQPADVVRWDGVDYDFVFKANISGVPPGLNVDAVGWDGSAILLSFDTSAELAPGQVFADEDVVRFDGSNYVMFFDGSANGIDPAFDLDGFHYQLGANPMLSLDLPGEIGGLRFDDEDVIEHTGGGVYAMVFDASTFHITWEPADAEAVFVDVPEPSAALQLITGVSLLAMLMRRRHRSRRSSGIGPRRRRAGSWTRPDTPCAGIAIDPGSGRTRAEKTSRSSSC